MKFDDFKNKMRNTGRNMLKNLKVNSNETVTTTKYKSAEKIEPEALIDSMKDVDNSIYEEYHRMKNSGFEEEINKEATKNIVDKIVAGKDILKEDLKNSRNVVSMALIAGGAYMFELSRTADTFVPIDSMSDQGLYVLIGLIALGSAGAVSDSKIVKSLMEQIGKVSDKVSFLKEHIKKNKIVEKVTSPEMTECYYGPKI